MQKLIELLNEYLSPFSGYIHYHNENGFKRTPTKSAVEGDIMLQDEYVLGKSFGFIQWLVENDKIDFYTILKENGTFRKEFYAIENRKEYERLIMLLSVEDEPIKFLISMLK